MSEREPGGFAVSDGQADACQCPVCQSPFIANGRKHDPFPADGPRPRFVPARISTASDRVPQ